MATYILTGNYMPGWYWPGLYWPITATGAPICPPYQVRGEVLDIDVSGRLPVYMDVGGAILNVSVAGTVKLTEVTLTLPRDCVPA